MFRNRKKQEELEDEPAFFENVAVPATEMISPAKTGGSGENGRINRQSTRRNPY